MKRIKYLAILINIISISFLVNAIYEYQKRKDIIASVNPIPAKEYSVLRMNCRQGTRGSSTMEIIYKAKKYTVSLTARECINWEHNNVSVPLFYMPEEAIVFTASGLTKRMIYVFGGVALLFLLVWFLPKKYW